MGILFTIIPSIIRRVLLQTMKTALVLHLERVVMSSIWIAFNGG